MFQSEFCQLENCFVKTTIDFLRKKIITELVLPNMSPDIKVITHLWGFLKREVEEWKPQNIQAHKANI